MKAMMKRILATMVALTTLVSLTACGGKTQSTPTPPPVVEEPSRAELAVEADLESYSAREETAADAALLDTSVSLTAEGLPAIEEAVAALAVDYPYQEIAQLETAYAAYRALPAWEDAPSSGVLDGLDAQTLYDRVKVAIEDHETDWLEDGGRLYVPLDDEYLRWVCEVLCDTLDQELAGWDFGAQLPSIDYNIANLRIFKNSVGYSNAAVADDGVLMVQPTTTEGMVTISSNEDAPAITVAHETEHLLQKQSNPRMEAQGVDRSYGFCRRMPELPVNSMFFTWMVEGAAEKLAVRLYDCEPTIYFSKISYLDSLTVPTLLTGADPQAVPRLTQQPSLDAVFQLLGCETEADQMELLRCLYAIEVIQTQPEDFFAEFQRQTGREITEEDGLVEVQRALKAPACLTMSKLFYRELAQCLTERELTLREVFYLMSMWEFDLNNHLGYDDETRLDTTAPFMAAYTELQMDFFDELAAGTDRSAEELRELFASCLCRCEVPKISLFHGNEAWTKGPELRVISAESNDFLNEYYRTVSQKKTIPVYRAAELLAANGKT